MTPQDIVKLTFQGEFGGGHLLSDYDRCLNWIEREYAEIQQDKYASLYEDIGFGFARIQLQALDANGLTPVDVANLFYSSASIAYGDNERYLCKLSLLPSLIDDRFSFSGNDMRAFIEIYLKNGGGMLSHSEAYRRAYHPAYRVIFQNQKKG